MAKETVIKLIDDINGEEAAETVNFGLDGTAYEIELTEANSKELRKAMAKYIENSRKVTGRKRS